MFELWKAKCEAELKRRDLNKTILLLALGVGGIHEVKINKWSKN